jgi:hypothetical protein
LSLEHSRLIARLLRVFHAPRRSFEAVVGRETARDWLAPILIVCVVGLVAYQVTALLMQDQIAAANRQWLEQQPVEARGRFEHDQQVMESFGWLKVPIEFFFSLVAMAWISLLLCRFLFRAEVTYRQMLVAKAYAMLVAAPECVAITALSLLSNSLVVYTGPGALLPSSLAYTYAGRALQAVNLFDLWQIWIMGAGLAVMARVPPRRARLALLALWGAWILFAAATEALAPQPAAS